MTHGRSKVGRALPELDGAGEELGDVDDFEGVLDLAGGFPAEPLALAPVLRRKAIDDRFPGLITAVLADYQPTAHP